MAYSSLLDVIVGCGDMVLLDPPNEDKVVENLKLRYSKKDIYVRRLVSVECARKMSNNLNAIHSRHKIQNSPLAFHTCRLSTR